MASNYLPHSPVGWFVGIIIMLVLLFAFSVLICLNSDRDGFICKTLGFFLSPSKTNGGKKRRQIKKKRH